MFGNMSFALFVALCLMGRVSAEICYSTHGSYYCSIGQSCGSFYGECRGLSTYAITGIVFASITLLSICIRCCIHLNAPTARPVVPLSAQRVGPVRVQVHPCANNMAAVPVHIVREQAPPSYAAATSINIGEPKY